MRAGTWMNGLTRSSEHFKPYNMSLTTGLIAVKGQYLDAIQDIVSAFRFVDNQNGEVVKNWNEVVNIITDLHRHSMGDYKETHVFWYHNGWTIMEDMSLILCADDEALEAISQRLNTPVFSLLTQGTSGCFGFWYFDKKKIRHFYIEDGTVIENYGKALAGEVKYNINENAFYDDVLGVARELGIDWAAAEKHDHFIVKELDLEPSYIEELRPLVEKHLQEQAERARLKKPWWKLW